MKIEDQIKAWREDDDQGYHDAIDLICAAEEELRQLRRANAIALEQAKDLRRAEPEYNAPDAERIDAIIDALAGEGVGSEIAIEERDAAQVENGELLSALAIAKEHLLEAYVYLTEEAPCTDCDGGADLDPDEMCDCCNEGYRIHEVEEIAAIVRERLVELDALPEQPKGGESRARD